VDDTTGECCSFSSSHMHCSGIYVAHLFCWSECDGTVFCISYVMAKLTVTLKSFCVPHMTNIEDILTEIDSSIYWIHSKLLIQSLHQQIALTFPKSDLICS
jgi:hypothetical protein